MKGLYLTRIFLGNLGGEEVDWFTHSVGTIQLRLSPGMTPIRIREDEPHYASNGYSHYTDLCAIGMISATSWLAEIELWLGVLCFHSAPYMLVTAPKSRRSL